MGNFSLTNDNPSTLMGALQVACIRDIDGASLQAFRERSYLGLPGRVQGRVCVSLESVLGVPVSLSMSNKQ